METVLAQAEYKPGWIITSEGDTLTGYIGEKGDLFMTSEVTLLTDSVTKTTYRPDEIRAFRIEDNRYFVTKDLDGEKIFMEYMLNGTISVFYFRDKNGDHYYLEKEGTGLHEVTYEQDIRVVDGKQVFFQSTKHIGLFTLYTQDAPQLQEEIRNIKKPDRQSIIKLAKDYHEVVCPGEECIIYTHRDPPVFIELAVEAGFAQLSKKFMDDMNYTYGKAYFNKNLLIFVGMPRVNKHMYFMTGFCYRGQLIDKNGSSMMSYKVPLTLEYRFEKKDFQPFLSIGTGFENGGNNKVIPLSSYGVGFKYVMKKMYISGRGVLDTLPLFLPGLPTFTLVSYSVNLGLGIRL